MIFVALTSGDPFAIETLKFDYENQCKDYVMNPANKQVLAIEVIARAGFNNPIAQIYCVPEQKLPLLGVKSEGLV